jgi:microcystin degradation protein MlrC
VKPRVAIAGLFHETNTYAPPTTLDQFLVLRGEAIPADYEGTHTYIGGMLDGIEIAGAVPLPVLYAEATPSGTITATALASLCGELIDRLVAAEPDAVLLALHGAGVAVGADSIEEVLCARVRERLGDSVPVVATLDLHGNLRPGLAPLCSGLFPVRENPHTDQLERGIEAARLAVALALGKPRPEIVIEPVPLLIPPTPSSHPVLAEVNALCARLERNEDLIALRLMHGFPYADLPHIGTSVVAVGVDEDAACAAARTVARTLWMRRDELTLDCLSAEEAVALAQRTPAPVLINEFSDNTGAGAPGDGTHLLRALIEADTHACFSHIFDPATVERAHRCGVGTVINVSIGGKTDPRHGAPLAVIAEVRSLGTGRFRVKSDMSAGETIDLGRLCALRVGSVDIVVTSGRRQTLDDGPFIKAGIDLADYPIVALKSSQHFRAFFGTSRTIVTANPPGISSADVTAFPRTRLAGPVWPLDRHTPYLESREPARAMTPGGNDR